MFSYGVSILTFDVTLSNIDERSLFTSRFHLYKNTKLSIETPQECILDLLQN